MTSLYLTPPCGSEPPVMGYVLDFMHKLRVEGVRISMPECARQIGVTTSGVVQVLRRKT